LPPYCLDANVFIQAKNGPYGMDIVPAFWDWLDRQAEAGKIYSSSMVYIELAAGDDELADWAHDRKDSKLFLEPGANVQQAFKEIADYVEKRYQEHYAAAFLEGADPWVVAHARVDGSIVVTHETLVPDDSSKIKIPNICRNFGVEYADPYRMLRMLEARFTLT